MNRPTRGAAALAAAALVLTGCTSAADRANENLSTAAENFEVLRRIVGINGITDRVLFSVEGFCSYESDGDVFEAICLVDRATGEVERTTLHLSDNVTFVSTQIGGAEVDTFRPRIIFRPKTIVPNFDLATPMSDAEREDNRRRTAFAAEQVTEVLVADSHRWMGSV